MKKINNKGFVLAETLVVTVFLMVLFTMIYSNFYPLIGEYEKRENYDDVDGKKITNDLEESIKNKDLVYAKGQLQLQKSMSFSSPSSAAMFVFGTSANGWTEWKSDDDRILSQIFRK